MPRREGYDEMQRNINARFAEASGADPATVDQDVQLALAVGAMRRKLGQTVGGLRDDLTNLLVGSSSTGQMPRRTIDPQVQQQALDSMLPPETPTDEVLRRSMSGSTYQTPFGQWGGWFTPEQQQHPWIQELGRGK